uniref:Gamma-glutamylcyclotransferase n=1 Tax=Erpetoichthys calabaricus TaxID=27687 RepID=A0A8C4ST59_ERPCA
TTCRPVDNEGDFFYYFAYGSNLLKERLLMANPSARFHCRGRLKGYSLKFGSSQGIPNKTWHGGSATIREAPGDEVWGVVWKMSTSDLQSLDRQECSYSPLLANVETENGELPCRTYQMNNCADKCPSPQYKYERVNAVLPLEGILLGKPTDGTEVHGHLEQGCAVSAWGGAQCRSGG